MTKKGKPQRRYEREEKHWALERGKRGTAEYRGTHLILNYVPSESGSEKKF